MFLSLISWNPENDTIDFNRRLEGDFFAFLKMELFVQKLLMEVEMQNLLTFGFVLKLQPFIHQLNPFALDLEEDQH